MQFKSTLAVDLYQHIILNDPCITKDTGCSIPGVIISLVLS